jgi:acyl-CoA synthetase (AMP-forming)/AMP-acid ligase II
MISNDVTQEKNLAHHIHKNALKFANKKALVFLTPGLFEADSVTFAECDQRAGALAAVFKQGGWAGKKAILLYPSGVDFVLAYVACLYAGVVPIPIVTTDQQQRE